MGHLTLTTPLSGKIFHLQGGTVTRQLYNFDLFRTCTSSFCSVAWQLARFQLTRRIARSVGDSWASCLVPVMLLLDCYTAAAPRTQAPPCADPPSLVPCTNRPFGHKRRYRKRLAIVVDITDPLPIHQSNRIKSAPARPAISLAKHVICAPATLGLSARFRANFFSITCRQQQARQVKPRREANTRSLSIS